jgi:hypothetical protein
MTTTCHECGEHAAEVDHVDEFGDETWRCFACDESWMVFADEDE